MDASPSRTDGFTGKSQEAMIWVACLAAIILHLMILAFVVYTLWYRANYITKHATKKHGAGWHKCWTCKSAESEMYWSDGAIIRTYKCLKCSKHL
jgi:hypothetical protein